VINASRSFSFSPHKSNLVKYSQVLLVASAEHKAAILRLIPEFAGRVNSGGGGGTNGRRPNDVIVLPRASLPVGSATSSSPAAGGGGSGGWVGNQAADSSYRAISLAGAAAAASADAAAAADTSKASTSATTTATGTGDERFENRNGIVVAADLSEPEVAAAVADFCQRTVQLLAASLRASSSSLSSLSSSLTDDALVVHVVPLPSGTGSSGGSSSGSVGSRRSGGSYDLPPVLVRLNGTSGSPGSSASSSSMSGSSRSSSASSSFSSGNSGRVEIRLHALSTTMRPHSSSSGSSGGSVLLAAVLAAARLHVVCTPVPWLRSGSMDLHVHEAMLAG